VINYRLLILRPFEVNRFIRDFVLIFIHIQNL